MMMEQPFYQVPPQGIIERSEDLEDTYSLSFAGTYQDPSNPVRLGPSSMAPISLVPPVMPSTEHPSFYDFSSMQTAMPWPVKNEGPDLSQPIPLRNTQVRHGQPTPPPYHDSSREQGFYDLANYQVDGFQAVNVPAPLPSLPQPSLPLAPVTYSVNVGHSPSTESDKSQSSPSPRRRRNKLPVATTKEGVEKQKASRSKFLERNRLAASKCRQKKKDQSNLLQARCNQEMEKRDALSDEAKQLNECRIKLKDQLIAHAHCGCVPIDAYLEQLVEDVTKVVTGSQPSPQPVASEYISSSSPGTSAFGFDGPAQFPSSGPEPWDEMARRASVNSFATDFTYSLVDGESVGNVEPDVDFDSLLDVNECA